MAEKLMVVIPCYNEEEVLPETSRRLVIKMGSLMEKGLISEDSKVLLVNDGSKDRTWELISDLHKENLLFEGVKLSRNRGHQNALLAGLMTARNPSTIVARHLSRSSACEGRVMGSTMNRLACMAPNTRFVPPASRVMTTRLSYLYMVAIYLLVSAFFCAGIGHAVRAVHAVRALPRSCGCTWLQNPGSRNPVADRFVLTGCPWGSEVRFTGCIRYRYLAQQR